MSDMSYKELYLTQSPMIVSPDDKSDPVSNIFGVPFDSTHSYKPGCRFGPDVIRDAFNNIEIFHPNLQVDLEIANIKDYGNIQHTVVATEMLEMVEKITNELRKEKKPLVILGGEHLLTLGSYMSFPKEVGYVVFDAHYDLRDEYANTKLSHAAYLRRIVEKRGADNIVHVGARSFVKDELEFLTENKINSISDSVNGLVLVQVVLKLNFLFCLAECIVVSSISKTCKTSSLLHRCSMLLSIE